MKRHFLTLAMASALPFLLSAQIVKVGSLQKVQTPADTEVKVAAISPDEQFILITAADDTGLQKIDLATGRCTHLTDANGAGLEVRISADSKEVIYQESTFTADHSRQTRLMRQQLEDKKISQLLPYTRDMSGYMIQGNIVFAVNKRKAQAVSAPEIKATAQPILTTEDAYMVLTRGEEQTILKPYDSEDAVYLWPSISPDGTKICYYVMGVGAYVADIDGSNAQFIAVACRAAHWYNNHTLIAMADRDNGEVITSSALVAYTLDGKQQTLTQPNLIAMYPQVATNGKKIAFSTLQGEAYILNLK